MGMQVLRVYQDGKEIASNIPDNNTKVWQLTVPVKAGSRYILAQQADLGDPYGGYRGQPGLRFASHKSDDSHNHSGRSQV